MAAAKKSLVMDVDIDSLWAVITDYESYPEFVDGCESTRIVERKGNKTLVEYKVNKIKKITYTLEHEETPKKRMQWKMVDGEFFKSNDGKWELKPKGKDKVEVLYELEVGMPALVPKAIVRGLVSQSLPEMMDGFERRAQELAGKG